jgi:hypothetical protein
LLDEIVGDAPVLFGLLGNTIANFEREAEVLRVLPKLIRPGKDFLLLETASTPEISSETMAAARDEYARSSVFCNFAVSSIVQNTDLPIDMKQTLVRCSEDEGALKIVVVYKSGTDTDFTLIGGDQVAFPAGDTIRLYLSRKYTQPALDRLLMYNGLRAVRTAPHAKHTRHGAGFGMTLSLCQFEHRLLASLSEARHTTQRVSPPQATMVGTKNPVSVVWVSYAHADAKWLEELKAHLEPSLRNGEIELLEDTQIAPGDNWRAQIDAGLRRCQVAVLLVTQEFVKSEFIANNELPPLLKAAEERGLKIIWIPISDSAWRETGLSSLQAASNPEKPLGGLRRSDKQSRLVEIANKIRTATRSKRSDLGFAAPVDRG